MANYNEQMQRLFDRYRNEVREAPVPLDDVYEWTVKNKLWQAREDSIRAQFKEEMAQALREQYRTDDAGRKYRAKHAVRHTFAGKQLSFWGDIDKDPRDYIESYAARARFFSRGVPNGPAVHFRKATAAAQTTATGETFWCVVLPAR
jgi:hypothetical protein